MKHETCDNLVLNNTKLQHASRRSTSKRSSLATRIPMWSRMQGRGPSEIHVVPFSFLKVCKMKLKRVAECGSRFHTFYEM